MKNTNKRSDNTDKSQPNHYVSNAELCKRSKELRNSVSDTLSQLSFLYKNEEYDCEMLQHKA